MARPGTFTSTFMHNGRRYYTYGKSQQEAKEKAIRKQALLEAGVKEYKSKLTVSEWAKEWLASYKQGTVSSKWYKQMEAYTNNQIEDNIGDRLLTSVRHADIQKMMNLYADRSESFQRKLLLVTRQIFESAVDNDIIDKNPTKRIKIALRASEGGYRMITEEERELTLKVADENLDDGIFFLIMLFCGCRPQEVSRLKMSDYDAENKVLHVRRARKADGHTGDTKSNSGKREIPVPDYLAERLDKLGRKQDDYICTALNGRPLTATSQQNLWGRFKRKMDIANGAVVFRNAIVQTTLADDFVPYCYRHTYCTDLQDAGVPITVAKVLMGHSDIQMTANIYTHRSEESIEDARKKINAKASQKASQKTQTI